MNTYEVINDNAYKVFCRLYEENPNLSMKELFPKFAKELALEVFDVCIDRYKSDLKSGKIKRKANNDGNRADV